MANVGDILEGVGKVIGDLSCSYLVTNEHGYTMSIDKKDIPNTLTTPLYAVGDVVHVHDSLNIKTFEYVTSSMTEYAGKDVTIKSVVDNNKYTIEGSSAVWHGSLFAYRKSFRLGEKVVILTGKYMGKVADISIITEKKTYCVSIDNDNEYTADMLSNDFTIRCHAGLVKGLGATVPLSTSLNSSITNLMQAKNVPAWVHEDDGIYYTPALADVTGFLYERHFYRGDAIDFERAKKGLMFRTPGEAEEATKKMLEVIMKK